MKTSKAKQIYEATQFGITEDIALSMGGYSKQEYETALKEYFKSLPKVKITFGPEEPKQDEYYCWQGTQLPRWFE